MKLFQPAGGYILAYGRGDNNISRLSLLNPNNNSDAPLPLLHEVHLIRCQPYRIFWTRSLTSKTDNYAYFNDHARRFRLAVYRPDNDRWDTIIDFKANLKHHSYFYLKDLLVLFEDHTGITRVMDISSHKELHVIPPPKDESSSDKTREGP
jgi:hypothetical protein